MAGGRQGAPGFDRGRLRARREAANLTRRQLAEAAGVHLIAIRQWETGHRVPTVETVAVLARALGVSPLTLTDRAEVDTARLTLRDLRISTGLTQEQAAAAAGMRRTTFSKIERGTDGALSPGAAQALADGLRVSIGQVRAAHAAARAIGADPALPEEAGAGPDLVPGTV